MFSGAGIGYLFVLVLPFLLLIFLFTSQRRRTQQIQVFQGSLEVGDEIVTTSGLYARIVELDDTVATIDPGTGAPLRFDRRAIGMRAGEGA